MKSSFSLKKYINNSKSTTNQDELYIKFTILKYSINSSKETKQNKSNLTHLLTRNISIFQHLLILSNETLNFIKFNHHHNELSSLSSSFPINQTSQKEFSFPIEILSCSIILDKLLLLLNNGLLYLYDFEKSEIIRINLPLDSGSLIENQEKPYELSRIFGLSQSSSSVYDTKIYITGGITLSSKLNIRVFSLDFSLLTVSEETIKENNFKGRYRHGSIIVNSDLFIIGGFSSIKNSLDSQVEDVIYIRIDSSMYTYKAFPYKGPSPKDIINPEVVEISKMILAFSSFKYNKLFCLDVDTKQSRCLMLKDEIPSCVSIVYFEEDEDEEQIFLYFGVIDLDVDVNLKIDKVKIEIKKIFK